MVYLRSLQLRYFRNYSEQLIQFTAPKTILVGNNAQGKTNLLEAIELLATLKSRRAHRDRELVQHTNSQARIAAIVERLEITHELGMDLRVSGRRSLQVNGHTLRRQIDFLGQLNGVLFSSLDLQLVRGGPDYRRSWLDDVLVQLEPVYASLLDQYRHVLKQRNAILKAQREQRRIGATLREYATQDLDQDSPSSQAFPRGPFNGELDPGVSSLASVSGGAKSNYHFRGSDASSDSSVSSHLSDASRPKPHDSGQLGATFRDPSPDRLELAAWDAELATVGSRLIRRRARLIERLSPLADQWHQAISGGHEHLTLTYQSQVPLADPQADAATVQAAFLAEIQAKAKAESAYGSSLVGPHRDEVEMTINQTPARIFGSQGQQRTLVLALKLAELELIEQVIGDPPLLLLDDVLAELDPHRQDQLLDVIQERVQTIVTTTHLGSFDGRWLNSAQIMKVHQGGIVEGP